MTAIVERRGADGLEFFTAPTDADAQGQAGFRQVVDGREQLRRQHRRPVRHHHH